MNAATGATPPVRQVRAVFDARSITVYQAYSAEIAVPAVAAQTFVPPFRRARMTWIKPSFRWMMYRCGWGTKPGQERILAVRISRAGFEEALSAACLSHFDAELHPDRDAWRARQASSPVRVQWDPERTLTGQPLAWRSLQIGIGGAMVDRYLDEWIVAITDITDHARRLRSAAAADPRLLPPERPYPLPHHVAATIGAAG